MRVEELRQKIDQASEKSEADGGKLIMKGKSGPVGYDMIRMVCDVLERQQREIDELRAKVK